ncbi:hypothetical protein N182_23970 [Sinorhizobium sp. GL2]|nr:hypothetical protein N182_23970 [Sinorhizobium sp. GL2]
MNFLGDVFQGFRPEIIEAERDLPLDLVVDRRGQVDGAWVGKALQPCGDVDAIAIKVVAIYQDIAEIDSDAQDDMTRFGQGSICGLHFPLQLDRSGQGIDRAWKLKEHTVTHQFDDAAAMRAYDRLENCRPTLLQRCERGDFILLHQSGVANNVRDDDGGEAAMNVFLGH